MVTAHLIIPPPVKSLPFSFPFVLIAFQPIVQAIVKAVGSKIAVFPYDALRNKRGASVKVVPERRCEYHLFPLRQIYQHFACVPLPFVIACIYIG